MSDFCSEGRLGRFFPIIFAQYRIPNDFLNLLRWWKALLRDTQELSVLEIYPIFFDDMVFILTS